MWKSPRGVNTFASHCINKMDNHYYDYQISVILHVQVYFFCYSWQLFMFVSGLYGSQRADSLNVSDSELQYTLIAG